MRKLFEASTPDLSGADTVELGPFGQSKEKKGHEGEDLVSDGYTDNEKGRGIVPDKKGGKTAPTAGRKYWKDVKSGTKVARVSSTYYTKDEDGWHEVYWKDNEGSDAIEHLAKISKKSGLPEARKDSLTPGFPRKLFWGTKKGSLGKSVYKRNPDATNVKQSKSTESGLPEAYKRRSYGAPGKKKPTQPTFDRKFFGKKYKPNMAVVGESLPDPRIYEGPSMGRGGWPIDWASKAHGTTDEPVQRFRNQLGTLSTEQLESYLEQNAHKWPSTDWHAKILRTFAQHHSIPWPKPLEQRESFVNMSQPASTDEEGADVESAKGASTVDSDEGVEEAFALLPDPGIRVRYEDIESLVPDIEEKMHRLQNDTKCTLTPHRKNHRSARKPIFGL